MSMLVIIEYNTYMDEYKIVKWVNDTVKVDNVLLELGPDRIKCWYNPDRNENYVWGIIKQCIPDKERKKSFQRLIDARQKAQYEYIDNR